jgi:hypothetical protein
MSKIVSAPYSFLPSLCFSFLLSGDLQDLLDDKNRPPINSALVRKCFRIFDTLDLLVNNTHAIHEMRGSAEGGNEKKKHADQLSRDTEMIMHQMCEVAEFLADTINVLIPGKMGQKKVASNAKNDIYGVINYDFKIPINLIKHDLCEMHWIEAENGAGYCFGFVLQSNLSPRLSGPASKIKPVAEAYSYFYLLRAVLPQLYKMCSLAETVLQRAGVIKENFLEIENLPSFDASKLFNSVAKMNELPLFGFPNESGLVVSKTKLGEDFLIFESDEVIVPIPGRVSVNVTATHVGAGYALQLPFATAQKSDPRHRIRVGKKW